MLLQNQRLINILKNHKRVCSKPKTIITNVVTHSWALQDHRHFSNYYKFKIVLIRYKSGIMELVRIHLIRSNTHKIHRWISHNLRQCRWQRLREMWMCSKSNITHKSLKNLNMIVPQVSINDFKGIETLV